MRNLPNMKVKLRRLISGGVIVNTDDYIMYEGIAEEIEEILEHRVVNHGNKEWARGSAHVNGCEKRNGFLKSFLRRYRGCIKEVSLRLCRFPSITAK